MISDRFPSLFRLDILKIVFSNKNVDTNLLLIDIPNVVPLRFYQFQLEYLSFFI